MGAHFRLPIYNATWEEIRSHVKRFELHCVLAAIDRGRAYFEADFRHPLSLIIGGETHGAGDDARQLADTLVKIPMPGGGDSLNASVAAGIILFEISRQKEINI
jgi:TrmH family RNA methyltransferase